jgi:hypothetical protein
MLFDYNAKLVLKLMLLFSLSLTMNTWTVQGQSFDEIVSDIRHDDFLKRARTYFEDGTIYQWSFANFSALRDRHMNQSHTLVRRLQERLKHVEMRHRVLQALAATPTSCYHTIEALNGSMSLTVCRWGFKIGIYKKIDETECQTGLAIMSSEVSKQISTFRDLFWDVTLQGIDTYPLVAGAMSYRVIPNFVAPRLCKSPLIDYNRHRSSSNELFLAGLWLLPEATDLLYSGHAAMEQTETTFNRNFESLMGFSKDNLPYIETLSELSEYIYKAPIPENTEGIESSEVITEDLNRRYRHTLLRNIDWFKETRIIGGRVILSWSDEAVLVVIRGSTTNEDWYLNSCSAQCNVYRVRSQPTPMHTGFLAGFSCYSALLYNELAHAFYQVKTLRRFYGKFQ